MTNSRESDKFVVRLPDGMRERIGAAAVAHHTSMNSIILQALESYFDGQQHQHLLLEVLSEKLEQLEKA